MNEPDVAELLNSKEIKSHESDTEIILEGQYQEAYHIMQDAYNAGLYVGLIGPVGAGKTALCRKFAGDLNRPFDWVTFSDLVRPSNLIGSFDPQCSRSNADGTQARHREKPCPCHVPLTDPFNRLRPVVPCEDRVA